MARDVIDELSLKIDIDVDKGASKTISSLARAITKLNSAVANVGNLQKYVRSLNKISPNTINVRSTTGVGQAMGKTVKPKFQEYTDKTESKGEIPSIAKNGNKAAEAVKNLGKESKKTKKELKDLDKNADKSSSTFKKLVRSIGRIAFYRAIRMALNQIAKGAVQGLENIRQMDGALDKSLKNLSLSQTSLYNSLAALLSPIIKTIEPTITKLSDSVAKIANRINEAQAALKGQTTYTKILTSDTKEWNEQLKKAEGHLLSFDRFEALGKNGNGYTGTIEAQVGMSANEAKDIVSTIEHVTQGIINLGVAITLLNLGKILKFITDTKSALVLLDGVLVGSLIYSISEAIQSFKDGDTAAGILATTISVGLVGAIILLNANLVKTIALKIVQWFQTLRLQSALATTSMQKLQLASGALFLGITALIGGIASLAMSWGEMKDWQKVTTIFISLAAAIGAAAAAFYIFKQNWAMAIGIGAVVAGVGLTIGSQLSVAKYADGGTFNKGQMFIAGEAGAEAVYNTSGGNGGVVNIEQFTTAMYNALSMYGAARSTDVHFGGDVYIDRTKAGQLLESSVYGEGVRVGHFAKR